MSKGSRKAKAGNPFAQRTMLEQVQQHPTFPPNRRFVHSTRHCGTMDMSSLSGKLWALQHDRVGWGLDPRTNQGSPVP